MPASYDVATAVLRIIEYRDEVDGRMKVPWGQNDIIELWDLAHLRKNDDEDGIRTHARRT